MRKKIVRRSWRERRFWLLAKVWQGNSRKGMLRRFKVQSLRFKVENAGKSRSSEDRFGHSRESNRRRAVLCALEPAFNSLSLPLNVAVELVVTAIVKPD